MPRTTWSKWRLMFTVESHDTANRIKKRMIAENKAKGIEVQIRITKSKTPSTVGAVKLGNMYRMEERNRWVGKQ